MGVNYKPWHINYNDFYSLKYTADKLRFLLKFAVLAPSTHNSQPWKFIISDSGVLVVPELGRTLPVTDPEYRLLCISLGCTVENLLIAADYYNYQTKVEYFPHEAEEITIRISLQENSPRTKSKKNHLIFAIPERRTNRSKYSPTAPKKEALSQLENFVIDAAAIRLATDSKKQKDIADILLESRLKAFDNKLFRKELAHYKRTNLTKSPLGMPGFTMGLNTPLSLITPFAIRHINVIRFLKKQEEKLLKKYTPVFGFVITTGDSKIDWVAAGRLFEHVVLEAECLNIQTAISAISPRTHKQLQEILDTPHFPQVFFRMGYATEIPKHSPRLSAEKVSIQKFNSSQYGK